MAMQREIRPISRNESTGLSSNSATGEPLVWREGPNYSDARGAEQRDRVENFNPYAGYERQQERSAMADAIAQMLAGRTEKAPFFRMTESPYAQQRAKQMDIMANGGRGGNILNPAIQALFYDDGPNSPYIEPNSDYEAWQRMDDNVREYGYTWPYSSYGPGWEEWANKYGA